MTHPPAWANATAASRRQLPGSGDLRRGGARRGLLQHDLELRVERHLGLPAG